MGVYGIDLENIMTDLITENFLNEERFARSYARGKFRVKRWGRNRILRELKMRKISDYCIRKAMEEIEDQEYQSVLAAVLQKKNGFLKEEDLFKRRNKLAQYAISRGFESELVWTGVKELIPV